MCCVFVCLCDIKSEYLNKTILASSKSSKKPHYLPDLSNCDTLLYITQQGPSGTKVPSLDMCRSTMSLSKIIHQVLHNHPFSQNNKVTKRALGLEAQGEGRGWTKFDMGG